MLRTTKYFVKKEVKFTALLSMHKIKNHLKKCYTTA